MNDNYNRGEPPMPYRPKKIGILLLIFFSSLPGANYMHMGFMKKGIFIMCSFFLTIYLLAAFNLPFLAFVIPIIWISSFFDGLKIRRDLNAGIHVEDNVDSILNFLNKYKVFILLFLLFCVFSAFFNNVISLVPFGNQHNIRRVLDILPPILIIIVGYSLIKSRFTKKSDIIDKRSND